MAVETGIIPPLTQNILEKIRDGRMVSESISAPTDYGLRQAYIHVDPDKVIITDRRDSSYFFQLMAIPYGELGIAQNIHVNQLPPTSLKPTDEVIFGTYKTRDGDTHHPYLYAGKLFHATVSHLRRNPQVKGLLGRWCNDEGMDTNYIQFRDALSRASADGKDEQERVKTAAFSTWTGIHAYDAGFHEVSVNSFTFFDSQVIYAMFTLDR